MENVEQMGRLLELLLRADPGLRWIPALIEQVRRLPLKQVAGSAPCSMKSIS
jgi:hypothetical protein